MAIVERQLVVAKRDNCTATHRGLVFTPKGRIYTHGGGRIGIESAVQFMAAKIEQEDLNTSASTPKIKGQPSRTDFTWDRLNEATHEFFFRLCEDIQTYTKDAGMTCPAPIDQLRIGLTNAPRLSNLKKAGLVISVEGAKKSHKWLRLTDSGRQLFLTTIGNS